MKSVIQIPDTLKEDIAKYVQAVHARKAAESNGSKSYTEQYIADKRTSLYRTLIDIGPNRSPSENNLFAEMKASIESKKVNAVDIRKPELELIERIRKGFSDMFLGQTLNFVGTVIPYKESEADQFFHVTSVYMNQSVDTRGTLGVAGVYFKTIGTDVDCTQYDRITILELGNLEKSPDPVKYVETLVGRFRSCDIADAQAAVQRVKDRVEKTFAYTFAAFSSSVGKATYSDTECHPEKWW